MILFRRSSWQKIEKVHGLSLQHLSDLSRVSLFFCQSPAKTRQLDHDCPSALPVGGAWARKRNQAEWRKGQRSLNYQSYQPSTNCTFLTSELWKCSKRTWFVTWWWQLKHFSFSSRSLGEWSNLTHIFKMGWNHQLVDIFSPSQWCCKGFFVFWMKLWIIGTSSPSQ